MKISAKDLVRLIVEADKQGYNQAVKHSDQAYDEYIDKLKAIKAIREAYDKAEGYGLKRGQGPC